MAENKNQHYVPKFILENFSNQHNTFVMYQRCNNNFHDSIPYKNQCQKDYFYGKDQKIENLFSSFENLTANIVKSVIEPESFRSIQSIFDYNIIQVFIVSQYLRTKGMLSRRKRAINQYEKKIKNIVHQFHNVYNHSETDDEALRRISPQRTNEKIISENVYAAFKFIEEYSDLVVLILDNKTIINFIISDDPVIEDNYYSNYNSYGLGSFGVLFLYPISPRRALLLVDAKAYFDSSNILDYIVIDKEEDILKINTWQFAKSELLYSFDRKSLEETIQRSLLYIKNNHQYAKEFLVKDVTESQPYLSMAYVENLANEKLSTREGFNEAIQNYVKYDNIPSFLRIDNQIRIRYKNLCYYFPLRKDIYK